jgi:hypothetical protein
MPSFIENRSLHMLKKSPQVAHKGEGCRYFNLASMADWATLPLFLILRSL